MNYPGNENLAEEIRERILNTFRQTLALAEQGDQREAQLGCDFVLRLDPLFEPARELSQRLQAQSGSIDVSDLKDAIGERASVDVDAKPQGADEAAETLSEFDASQNAPVRQATHEALDPVLPATEDSGAESDPVVLDLDTGSSALESALDLSSLQTPPAAEPPGAEVEASPGTGADTEPVATLDNESEQRVQDLLTEGQAAFDTAEYQSAIDAWSRIFLIDIDHPEANRRIDLARKLKAEVERKLEETYHDALTKVEAGRLDEARAGFRSVLQMMPEHVAAQEYLNRLDAPDFVAPEPTAPAEPRVRAAGDSEDHPASAGEFDGRLTDSLDDAPDLPSAADPHHRPSIGGVGRASKPPRSPSQTFRTVGAAMFVVLAVIGWFLYQNWDSFFPNALDASGPVQLDPITRAKRTYAEAGAAIAIAQLRRLSPGHPQYAEAQALVAQWEATLDASKPKQDAPAPEELAARDEFVREAGVAFANQEFLLAQELLERGGAQTSLEGDAKEMLEQAKDNLIPLQSEIAMFRDGEWEMSLRNLWRIREDGLETPDVRRLMVDSYFNLGVRDLQRQDPQAALVNLQEAKELSGDDAELSRLVEFAEVYQNRKEDLLYRIFVKYLPFR